MSAFIDVEKAEEMRKNGCSFQMIADEFGVSRQAVQQMLKRLEKRRLKQEQKQKGE